eukprot:GHUV01005220.1.p2 GENE.GHUV01005220.1~~GHUV01005220.1.p2  ORF type:complete len:116 (-),score=8.55 GHUV01005220.1:1887-2234(-)
MQGCASNIMLWLSDDKTEPDFALHSSHQQANSGQFNPNWVLFPLSERIARDLVQRSARDLVQRGARDLVQRGARDLVQRGARDLVQRKNWTTSTGPNGTRQHARPSYPPRLVVYI